MTNKILTSQQMAEADKATIGAGAPSFELMKRAGKAIFDDIVQNFDLRKVLVLCGCGNNGGDGFIVAKLLMDAGYDVEVACMVEKNALRGDALRAADEWGGDIASFGNIYLSSNMLVIDAIFGTGLSKPLSDTIRCVLKKVSDAGCKVVAVDIPSGINGTTAEVDIGAIKTNRTITIAYKKLGHILYPAASLCGNVVVCDIGIKSDKCAAIENSPNLWNVPFPNSQSHKYMRGHCVVFGGCSMAGAALLAAQASMRIGAGLCSVVAHKSSAKVYLARMPDHILFETMKKFPDHVADARRNAVLVGCGVVVDVRDSVIDLLKTGKKIVLDAGAITCFEGDAARFCEALHENVVITPHEGEFAKVFGNINGNKLERAQKAADIAGCTVLLKGADTVIAAPNKTPVINTNGSPYLATAGSGDVLAGLILGLLAQGMDAFDAPAAAAWIHGKAGKSLGAGLIASDIIKVVPQILACLETKAA